MYTQEHNATTMKFSNRASLKEGRALQISNAFSTPLRKKYAFFIITSFILISACLLLFLPSHHKALVIEEKKTGNILWQREIKPDDWFRHEYIHSVEQSLVIEKFMVDKDGQIFAMESWTRSFGAGMPYEQRGTVEMVDGFYILKDLYDPIDVIHMMPSHLHRHTFHFKEEEIVLSEPPYTRNVIKFEVRKLNWYEYILLKLS